MRKPIIFLLLISLALWPVSLAGAAPPASAQPERKIVVFDETIVNEAAQEALVGRFGTPLKSLPIINGWVVVLPPQATVGIARISGVVRVDDDVRVSISRVGAAAKPEGKGKPKPPAPDQVLPWGVDRIDADQAWATSTGTGVKVAIIDTGIDSTHSDLRANLLGGVNTINPKKSWNDDNGHGTHVAGIVAAEDNTFGVVGVSHSAGLYAVKVLDRNGSGWLSDVIEGLQWAKDNGAGVVNMSLGTSSNVQSFHDAVIELYNAGIVQVAAAGNSGPGDGTVSYPAAYAEVIAVAATDSSDGQPYWSSRGPEVDLAAPGASIYSTYRGDTYATLSGTSMAAPHVAGAVALLLQLKSGLTPDEVKADLQSTAEWLSGLTANQQGAGLVDAEALVTAP
ncbi:MAG: S8 family peptidase [Coriobacteriia bacterium]|nr:S8 family peptidase [Coriobacteriia bacterium]